MDNISSEMEIESSEIQLSTIQLAIEFVKAWLGVEFKFLSKKKNKLSYFESKRSHKNNIKHQITDIFKWFHREFLVIIFAKYGLKLVKIVLSEANLNSTATEAEIVDEMKIEFFETENKKDLKQKIRLYKAKEENNISDKSYQDFINEGAQFGSLRFARKCRSILNNQFRHITNNHGVFNVPEEKFKYYFRLHKEKFEIIDTTIHIRLAGDGTNIANNYTVQNFTFSFLNKYGKMNARSEVGIYLLGVFKIKSENYASLKEALKELVALIKSTKEIDIDGEKYKIEYWLGGDMKFLLLGLGNFSLTIFILTFSNNSY